MNILNEIAEKTRERIEKDKIEMPREDLIREIQQKKVQMLLNPLIQSETAKTPHSFYQALKKPGMSYICEVKKASPSKGLIAPDFPYLDIAKEYKADVIAEIENSNFNPNVITSCISQANANGYTLSVQNVQYDEDNFYTCAEVVLGYKYTMPLFNISADKTTRGIAR